MAGPLHGVRVVDLTTVVMGPYATRIMGDLGADVIKIEPPAGDSTRRLGAARHPGMGSYFMNINRNKRSVVLDLKHEKGAEAVRRLVAGADVLVSNIRPRAMARLGLCYEDLRGLNPRLVHASLVGYGQDGPYAPRPAYDDLMQGATGIAALAAEAAADGVPRYAPLNMADRTVGVFAANAVLAALYARERTGEGQAVEVPMFETMTDFVMVEHLGGLSFEPQQGPHGYSRTLDHARRPYRTRDGFIATQVYNDRHWRDFFALSGNAGRYDDDPRFRDLASRTRHVGEVYGVLADILRHRDTDEWLAMLNAADIPATRVHDVHSLVTDPHHAATGFFQLREHPSEGTIRSMRVASRWSSTVPQPQREAPRLGEHGPEVLAEAGYAPAQIVEILDARHPATPQPHMERR